jgi:hypothetical protein
MPDNIEAINKQQASYDKARIDNLKQTALNTIYVLYKKKEITHEDGGNLLKS